MTGTYNLITTPSLSWPANAGHPVDVGAIFAGLFLSSFQASREFHLGGPHLRAATSGGA
jgi:hypothetical protein